MSKAKTSMSRTVGLSLIVLLLGGLWLGFTALRETTNLKTRASNTKPSCEDLKSIKIESCGKVGWLRETNKCKTERRKVQLTLDSSRAKQMRFKEIAPTTRCGLTDETGWSDWENYAVRKDFKLSGNHGNKKVCVTFKNDLGESKCGGNIRYVENKPAKPTAKPGAGDGAADNWCPNTDCDKSNTTAGVIRCKLGDRSNTYCCPINKPQIITKNGKDICAGVNEIGDCEHRCTPASSCKRPTSGGCESSTLVCCEPEF